ncbi:unnamed protein product [Caenorhabditis sp. 36 PRJEB53466]|nr:unnamed protein product [Caenorhabditis sp. 36 PRJEB53466]
MSRLLAFSILFLTFLSFSTAAPTEEPSLFSKILKEYKDLLPSEVVEAYKSLTDADKAALKSVFKNYKNYKNEKELIAALKEASPELGAKAEKLYGELQKKIAGLSEEPKKFVDALIAGGRALHAQSVSGEKIDGTAIKTLIQEQVSAYKLLSTGAQDELKTTFPGVTKFLQDEKVQNLIAKLVEKNNNN